MSLRFELDLLQRWVQPEARVLDLGCGDGALLLALQQKRNITGFGVEIDPANISACLRTGLHVVEQDIDQGLSNFEDGSFDMVIMTYTLQEVQHPLHVLQEMLRIGHQAVVSFPNFAYWRCRAHLLLRGTMPVSSELPAQWYDTQNIHLCTVRDFEHLCAQQKIQIQERAIRGILPASAKTLANLLAESAVYLLSR